MKRRFAIAAGAAFLCVLALFAYAVEIEIGGDAVPSVSLHNPADASNTTNGTVLFRCNATDDLNLTNVTLYFNVSSWHANQTNSTPANNSLHNFTKTIPDGIYAWNCRAGDNATQYAFAAANFTLIVDSQPPRYQFNSTNTTVSGAVVLFSLNWTENLIGLSRYVFSLDNGTGTFTNDSAVSLSGTSEWSNVTKVVNQTTGTTIRWIVYAWDTAGNANNSQTYSFTTAADAAPKYSSNSTNASTAGQAIEFRLYWTEDLGLRAYIFSFDNGNGSFVNDSFTELTGTANWSNVTKTVNSTSGSTVRWIVYANDSASQWNNSLTYSLNVTADTQAPRYQHNSTNSTNAGMAIRFNLNWTDDTGIKNYIFSFDNGNGSFANDSAVSLTGASNWSNVTKNINSTVGVIVRWRIWSNDTSDNQNASQTYSLNTTNETTENKAPFSMRSPEVIPDPADNSTDLNCSARFADPNNSTFTHIFTWYKGGTQNTTWDSNSSSVSNATVGYARTAVNKSALTVGSSWYCSVRAFDGILYSDWVNSSAVEIVSNASVGVTRMVVSCPLTLSNQSTTITVAYYKASKLSCTGITVEVKHSNGTALASKFVGSQKCLSSSKAEYALSFPGTDTYTVTASVGGTSASCKIDFRTVQLFPARVPEFNLLLLPLTALLALLALRLRRKKLA